MITQIWFGGQTSLYSFSIPTVFMAAHNELGKWGEQIAADHMVAEGWYIRHIDWRDKHRDIDLVCIDGDMTTLVFVEVKTRSTDDFGAPDLAIDFEKKNNILRAAANYVHIFQLEHLQVRFDTISIIGTPGNIKSIEHKEDAFDTLSTYLFYEQKRKRAYFRKQPGRW